MHIVPPFFENHPKWVNFLDFSASLCWSIWSSRLFLIQNYLFMNSPAKSGGDLPSERVSVAGWSFTPDFPLLCYLIIDAFPVIDYCCYMSISHEMIRHLLIDWNLSLFRRNRWNSSTRKVWCPSHRSSGTCNPSSEDRSPLSNVICWNGRGAWMGT